MLVLHFKSQGKVHFISYLNHCLNIFSVIQCNKKYFFLILSFHKTQHEMLKDVMMDLTQRRS